MKVAYFSAEFGLHESLPIYSGGLGILAGDHLKSADELSLPPFIGPNLGLCFPPTRPTARRRLDGSLTYSHSVWLDNRPTILTVPVRALSIRFIWHTYTD